MSTGRTVRESDTSHEDEEKCTPSTSLQVQRTPISYIQSGSLGLSLLRYLGFNKVDQGDNASVHRLRFERVFEMHEAVGLSQEARLAIRSVPPFPIVHANKAFMTLIGYDNIEAIVSRSIDSVLELVELKVDTMVGGESSLDIGRTKRSADARETQKVLTPEDSDTKHHTDTNPENLLLRLLVGRKSLVEARVFPVLKSFRGNKKRPVEVDSSDLSLVLLELKSAARVSEDPHEHAGLSRKRAGMRPFEKAVQEKSHAEPLDNVVTEMTSTGVEPSASNPEYVDPRPVSATAGGIVETANDEPSADLRMLQREQELFKRVNDYVRAGENYDASVAKKIVQERDAQRERNRGVAYINRLEEMSAWKEAKELLYDIGFRDDLEDTANDTVETQSIQPVHPPADATRVSMVSASEFDEDKARDALTIDDRMMKDMFSSLDSVSKPGED